MAQIRKQNLTVSLSTQTVQKAKIVDAEEVYENSHRAALDLMERGFHLGGIHSVHRDELHKR